MRRAPNEDADTNLGPWNGSIRGSHKYECEMNFVAIRYATGRYRRGVGAAQKLAQNLKKSKDAPDRPCPSFVRSFQGPRGQTHTHKPRKGVRGRRSTGKKIVRVHVPVKRHRGEPGHTRTHESLRRTSQASQPTNVPVKKTPGGAGTHTGHTRDTRARAAHTGGAGTNR